MCMYILFACILIKISLNAKLVGSPICSTPRNLLKRGAKSISVANAKRPGEHLELLVNKGGDPWSTSRKLGEVNDLVT